MSPDPYRKQRIFWFATMNALAVLTAALLFALFLFGHRLDFLFEKLVSGLFEYKLAIVLIAMSPLFASLLVGMAYAKRAIARKRGERVTRAPSAA
jgi:hypothetical protein